MEINLEEHYNKLYKEAVEKISSGNCHIDRLIDFPSDKRYGMTLIIRPPLEIKNKIQTFLNELRAVEPGQYYYSISDIHVTFLPIITCCEGFDMVKIELSEYIELIKRCLKKDGNIKIKFKGVTASSSCIMIQGFMNNNELNNIRDTLRVEFKNSALEQSIDRRYAIQTAHSTVLRFREKLNDEARFLKIVEKYRDFDFGLFEVSKLELLYNDWYHKKNNVKVLHIFEF